MSDKVRILRVLEYIGDRQWIDDQIARRLVKGTYVLRDGVIREAIIGDVPELLAETTTDEEYNRRFAESLKKDGPTS